MKGQLMGEQNAEETNSLFQLVQTYTLRNGTVRHANAPDHASTHVTGIT
jgi:hypothetical protein